ncbi:MAG: hypothetical protein WC323_00420 [Patescibacteria group bacterium]|jgi:hypothetical protein
MKNLPKKSDDRSTVPVEGETKELKSEMVKQLNALKKESKLMRDIMDDMKDLFRMLTAKMKQFGITPEELEEIIKEPGVKPAINEHPLISASRSYTKMVTAFLDEFFYEHQKMVQQFNIELPLDDIHDEIETISAYHLILVSKSWNLLKEYNNKSSKNTKHFYYLVKQAIDESLDAVKSFGEKRDNYSSKTKELLKLLAEAKKEIDKFKV